MSESEASGSGASGIDAETADAVRTVVDRLPGIGGDTEAGSAAVDVLEGTLTGTVYVDVGDSEYRRATVTPEGLAVETVTESDVEEDLEPVAHVDPDPGQTVADAVDDLTFAGD